MAKKLGSFLELTQRQASGDRHCAGTSRQRRDEDGAKSGIGDEQRKTVRRQQRSASQVRNAAGDSLSMSTRTTGGNSDTSETSAESASNFETSSMPVSPALEGSERRKYQRRGSCTKMTMEEDSNHVRVSLTPKNTKDSPPRYDKINDEDEELTKSPGTPVKAGRRRLSLRRSTIKASPSREKEINFKNQSATKSPKSPRKKLSITLGKKRESPSSRSKKIETPQKFLSAPSLSTSSFQYPTPFNFDQKPNSASDHKPRRQMTASPKKSSFDAPPAKPIRSSSVDADSHQQGQQQRTIDELPIPLSPIKRSGSQNQFHCRQHHRESSPSDIGLRRRKLRTPEPKRVSSAPSRFAVSPSFQYPTRFQAQHSSSPRMKMRSQTPPQSPSYTTNTTNHTIDERPIPLRNSTHGRRSPSEDSYDTIDQLPIPMRNSSHRRTSSHHSSSNHNIQWNDDSSIRSNASFHEDEDCSEAVGDSKGLPSSRNYSSRIELPPLNISSASVSRSWSMNTSFNNLSQHPALVRRQSALPPRAPAVFDLPPTTTCATVDNVVDEDYNNFKSNSHRHVTPLPPPPPPSEEDASETSSPLPPPPFAMDTDDYDDEDLHDSYRIEDGDDDIVSPQPTPRKVVSLSAPTMRKKMVKDDKKTSHRTSGRRGGHRKSSRDKTSSRHKHRSLPMNFPFAGQESNSAMNTDHVASNQRSSHHRRNHTSGEAKTDVHKTRRKPPSSLPSSIPFLSPSASAATTATAVTSSPTKTKRRLSLTSLRKSRKESPPVTYHKTKEESNEGWRSPLMEEGKKMADDKPTNSGWVSPLTGKSLDNTESNDCSPPLSLHFDHRSWRLSRQQQQQQHHRLNHRQHCTPSPARHARKLNLRCPPTR